MGAHGGGGPVLGLKNREKGFPLQGCVLVLWTGQSVRCPRGMLGRRAEQGGAVASAEPGFFLLC